MFAYKLEDRVLNGHGQQNCRYTKDLQDLAGYVNFKIQL